MFKNHVLSLIIASSFSLFSSISLPSYSLEIPQNRLQQKTLTVKVAPGQVTAIHFTTGEKIMNYLVSDPTKLIHNLNAPQGEATTFMLREIKADPLNGATRSSVPNLLLTTRLPDGTTQLYEFLIIFEDQINNNERVIRVTPPSYRLSDHRLFTSKGEVTLDHVQAGLIHILATQQASSRDPIVQQIRRFLSLANQMSLEQALETSQLDISAIKRLGEIGVKLKYNPLLSND